jgi:hypothetical protein
VNRRQFFKYIASGWIASFVPLPNAPTSIKGPVSSMGCWESDNLGGLFLPKEYQDRIVAAFGQGRDTLTGRRVVIGHIGRIQPGGWAEVKVE